MLHGEGAIQADLDQADLFAFAVHAVDGLLDGFAAGAHGDDDAIGVGRADVIEQVILAAGNLLDDLHLLFDDGGRGEIVLVGRFAVLEVNVGVLRGAALDRMLRIQRAGAEFFDLLEVDIGLDLVVIDRGDLLHFVRGAEAVEEVQERHAGFDGAQMGDKSHIHGFLHAVGGEHRETGLAAGHNVAVIAKDGQRVRGQRAGGNMEDAGKQFAGDLVHVGDHQQQALRSSVGRSERARDERAVHSARSAGFGLHLVDMHSLAEQVQTAMRRPFVDVFSHRRGRRNGEDSRHIAKRIRNVADGGIAVNGHFCSHQGSSLSSP